MTITITTPQPVIALRDVRAALTLQAWQGDYAITLAEVHADLREAVLDCTADEIRALEDGDYSSDHLAADALAAMGHSGPHEVYVVESLTEALVAAGALADGQALGDLTDEAWAAVAAVSPRAPKPMPLHEAAAATLRQATDLLTEITAAADAATQLALAADIAALREALTALPHDGTTNRT